MRLISCLSVLGSVGLLAASLVGCGGGDLAPEEACKQAMSAMCERASTCGGSAALTEMGYSSVDDCSKGMRTAHCNTADITCDSGETFQSDQAKKCIADLKTQSCSEVSSGNEPQSCSVVCAPGGGSGKGGSDGHGGTSGGGHGGGMGYGGAGYGGNVGHGGSTGRGGSGSGGSTGRGGSGSGGSTGRGGSGSGGAGGGGSLSALDACNQIMDSICDRTNACVGADGLTALGYSSLSECKAGMREESCSAMPAGGCDSGQTYHADQGKKCADGMAVLACSDVLAGSLPAACDLMCQ